MSPKPVKTARHAFWLATHWKLALLLAVIVAPLLIASYSTCSKTPDGCSTIGLAVGAVRIVAEWVT